MEAVLTGINGMLFVNSPLSVRWVSYLRAFVDAVATVFSVLGFGPALAVCFFFFSLFELNRILAVVFGRTHFGSQVEFCGLCSSLTCTPSALVRDSRAMIEPYILG